MRFRQIRTSSGAVSWPIPCTSVRKLGQVNSDGNEAKFQFDQDVEPRVQKYLWQNAPGVTTSSSLPSGRVTTASSLNKQVVTIRKAITNSVTGLIIRVCTCYFKSKLMRCSVFPPFRLITCHFLTKSLTG